VDRAPLCAELSRDFVIGYSAAGNRAHGDRHVDRDEIDRRAGHLLGSLEQRIGIELPGVTREDQFIGTPLAIIMKSA
jgi:hypothetical protein